MLSFTSTRSSAGLTGRPQASASSSTITSSRTVGSRAPEIQNFLNLPQTDDALDDDGEEEEDEDAGMDIEIVEPPPNLVIDYEQEDVDFSFEDDQQKLVVDFEADDEDDLDEEILDNEESESEEDPEYYQDPVVSMQSQNITKLVKTGQHGYSRNSQITVFQPSPSPPPQVQHIKVVQSYPVIPETARITILGPTVPCTVVHSSQLVHSFSKIPIHTLSEYSGERSTQGRATEERSSRLSAFKVPTQTGRSGMIVNDESTKGHHAYRRPPTPPANKLGFHMDGSIIVTNEVTLQYNQEHQIKKAKKRIRRLKPAPEPTNSGGSSIITMLEPEEEEEEDGPFGPMDEESDDVPLARQNPPHAIQNPKKLGRKEWALHKIKQLQIKLTMDEIINMDVNRLNNYLYVRPKQTEEQIEVIKAIRRRGKNKVAARRARQRKADGLDELRLEVTALYEMNAQLEEELTQLTQLKVEASKQFQKLVRFIRENMNIISQEEETEGFKRAQAKSQNLNVDPTYVTTKKKCT